MEPCQKAVRYAGASSFGVLTLFLGVLTWQAATLPIKVSMEVTKVGQSITARLDAFGTRLDATDKQANKMLEHIDAYVYSDDVLANLETTTAILRESYEVVHEVRTKTLPEVDGLFSQTRELLAGIQKDADKLTEDAEPLKAALSNVATLLVEVDKQVKEGGPRLTILLDKLSMSVQEVDNLLTNPKIAETLSNVDDTTKNIAETTKSVDIYLRPLRAKFSLLKTAINKALDMVKFTVPLFSPRMLPEPHSKQ